MLQDLHAKGIHHADLHLGNVYMEEPALGAHSALVIGDLGYCRRAVNNGSTVAHAQFEGAHAVSY